MGPIGCQNIMNYRLPRVAFKTTLNRFMSMGKNIEVNYSLQHAPLFYFITLTFWRPTSNIKLFVRIIAKKMNFQYVIFL